MKYKMVVFDLDGTILDTIADLCNAVNYSLNSHKLPLITINQAKAFLGFGIKALMLKASKNHPDDLKLLNCFKQHYYEHYNDCTKPYVGIKDVINYCHLHDIKIGVLTNKVENVAIKLCDSHFKDDFLFVYGDKEGRKRKPDPETLLKIMSDYNLTNKDVLYIGDSEVDVNTALNAGCGIVLCTYGFRDKEELLMKFNEDIMVDKAIDIINFLK